MPLAPLYPNDFPSTSEVNRTVVIRVQQLVSGNIIWVANGNPWTEVIDPYPYLVALYNNDTSQLPSYEAATGPNGTGMDNRTFDVSSQNGRDPRHCLAKQWQQRNWGARLSSLPRPMAHITGILAAAMALTMPHLWMKDWPVVSLSSGIQPCCTDSRT